MILNNYTNSISNIAFWIENPDLVTRLHAIEQGEIKPGISKRKEGNKLVEHAMYYTEPAPQKDISELLASYFMLSKPKEYLKFYYRYVKTYCNEMGLEDDGFFLTLAEIRYLLNLPAGKYNLDEIVHTVKNGFGSLVDYNLHHDTEVRQVLFMSWIEDFAIKATSFEKYITAAIAKYPDKVAAYKKGNANLFNMFFGEVMKNLPSKNVDKQALSTEIKEMLERC